MNLKTTLLTATAVTLMAGVANARDFTGSLFLPNKGEVLSNTAIDYSRAKFKHADYAGEALVAGEEITYGASDNFSVYGKIANAFDFKGVTNRDLNNEHNFAYELGGKYNYNFGRILTQIGAGYYTLQPSSWYGHKGNSSDWYKEIDFEAQIGYDAGNGLTPYAKLDVDTPIDQEDREVEYSLFAGVHKTFDKAAVDTGIRYDFNTDNGANTNEWYWQIEANYFVKNNIAVGVYGDYYLGGSFNDAIKYDYTAGVNLKVLF